MDLVIRNASIAGETGFKDVGIQEGRIAVVCDRLETRGKTEIQAEGYLVSPAFIDVHTHLDKALILDRYDWARREQQATRRLTSVFETNKVKPTFTVEDVRNRAIRVARMCAAHGTTTIRTHADVDPVIGLTGIKGVLAARAACREFIDMQVVANPFCGYYYEDGFAKEPGMEQLFREAIELGADAIGGVTEADPDPRSHIDLIFALAKEYGKSIDFHADQTATPPPFHIPYICEKTIEEGMQGKVLLGHCIALGHISIEERKQAIEGLRNAQVSVCGTPYSTVVERILEPAACGVAATYMSDNIRDSWQPHGNGDMLQLALFVARLGQVNTNRDLDGLLEMGTLTAARSIGLADEFGVAVGRRADLVIFEATSPREAILEQAKKLWVLKKGRAVAHNGKMLLEPTLST